MTISYTNYLEQRALWPKSGKHILAQFTDEHIVVYQAYNRAIGAFAAENQFFGGEFSFTRMSWIKTNFLWMMYRSGWGTKPNQETTLAISLKKEYFLNILENAYQSSNTEKLPADVWKKKITKSNVRLQWDPDHNPYGGKEERKAVQLGLRKSHLAPFRGEGIVEIEDISDFVSEQRVHVKSRSLELLKTPTEKIFDVPDNLRSTLSME